MMYDGPYRHAGEEIVSSESLYAMQHDDSCSKCGADLDDGECEECERAAPLDFDT